jgi:prepilin-type N-terminal cleavage/methylation domain-containing protein
MKKLKKRQQGFTIIEVMIVLVIAAVILLIVFLAVPALQRNSRNTQRKNDAANVLAAVNEYASNHNGQLPDSAQFIADVIPNFNTGFYDKNTEIIFGGGSGEDSDMYVLTGFKCDSEEDNGLADGSNRQFVVMFRLENSSGLAEAPFCQEG